VFERFTDRARRVVVLAQEEARLLHHDFIGTEHLLLGLVREDDGVAAKALEQLGISWEAARQGVLDIVGSSTSAVSGSPPFTPRAKKVLELSLREALQLGHNYIGTEHLLLGLVREGEGVAAQVLINLGVELGPLRQLVLSIVSGLAGHADTTAGSVRTTDPVECSFCTKRPPESGQLVAGRDGAYICEHCIRRWSGSVDNEPEAE
jgi:ATP-dependent Clp protease ATP-binding subunit ClpC